MIMKGYSPFPKAPASPSDCLVSYPGHSLGEYYLLIIPILLPPQDISLIDLISSQWRVNFLRSSLLILTWMSQKFCHICIYAIFWNKLQECDEIELMTHPADCLDQSPSDYYSFWSMAQFLRLQCFNNKLEVESSVKEFFALNNNWYQRGIKELVASTFNT